jgi:DNA-directed RNA polymerase specialized sigma24 family protein
VVHDATVELSARAERVRSAYEAVHVPLWRALFAFSGSREIADEAEAEAWAQVLRRGDGVDDPAAWAWRSAFRIAAGELKRRSGAATSGVAPDLGVTGPESTLDLMAAIRQLNEQQRACVVLCDLAGYRATETAHLLHMTAGAVRMQRMRAHRRLRELLEDHNA